MDQSNFEAGVLALFRATLFFGAAQPRMNDRYYCRFADCFVVYEEREDGDGETYMVAVPYLTLKPYMKIWPLQEDDHHREQI